MPHNLNKKISTFFLQFYIALMSFYALFLAISHFISCLGTEWQGCPAYSAPSTIIFLLFLMLVPYNFYAYIIIMAGFFLRLLIGKLIFSDIPKKNMTYHIESISIVHIP